MGAILELTEKLKEPTGIIGLVVLIAVIYFFWKWVSSDPEDEGNKNK